MSYRDKKHAKSSWVSPSVVVEKPWGREIRWNALPSINGKILYLEKGKQNSFKYNEPKNECLFVSVCNEWYCLVSKPVFLGVH